MKSLITSVVATLLTIFSFGALAADSFPSRSVKMIVPYPAGGVGDILSRSIADVFRKITGQAMIVENRPGANGMIGTAACKNAVPDGYTYCMPVADAMAINPHIYKKISYDVENDFVAVAPVASVVLAFVVNDSVPASNLKDFASWSKLNPRESNFATWGVGSAAHLLQAEFNSSMDADLTDVPYTGVPQMLQAIVAGDASSTLIFYGSIASFVKEGKLKPLAVLADERYHSLPDTPTMKEAGFNFTPTVYYGAYAPAGTPSDIVSSMNEIINKALTDPAVMDIMNSNGFVPMNESREEFANRVKNDRAAWKPAADALKLALD